MRGMLPGPDFAIAGRRCSAFRACGIAGYLLALALASILAAHAGLRLGVVAVIGALAPPVFFAVAMATKIVTGEERIVYYHHEIAFLAAAALLLGGMGEPRLPYLDVAALGLGGFLASGRFGCLLAGCCHGRPHPWGLRYGWAHVAAGYPASWAGIRLFPVQAVEALWVLGVVASGAAMMWQGAAPGSAFAWYVAAYGLGRFALEFARGDAARRYWLGFSEAQWISLVLGAGVAVLELRGDLALHRSHIAAAVLVAAGMAFTTVWRRFAGAGRITLLYPAHVNELACGVALVRHRRAAGIRPLRTSLGIALSGGEIVQDGTRIRHYSFSLPGASDEQSARILGRVLARLDGGEGARLIGGTDGVFHLVIGAEAGKI